MSFWQDFPTNRLLADLSLWSADLTRLGEEITRVDPYADLYHLDVSDAHFTPNLLFFPDLVAAVRPITRKKFHVHLMVDKPQSLIDAFAEAGADMISIQMGKEPLVKSCLEQIEKANCSAGLAFKVTEDPSLVVPYLDFIEVVIMLGTALGVKGQSISGDAYSRMERMKSIIARSASSHKIRVAADGGIRSDTVPQLRTAGADIVVMGSLAFRSDDLSKTFRWIRSL
jgi:ribulose-phosphate 3-epimerase